MVGGPPNDVGFLQQVRTGGGGQRRWEGPIADKDRLGQDKRWNGHSTGTRCTASRLELAPGVH